MNFQIDFQVAVNDQPVPSRQLLETLDQTKDELDDLSYLEGAVAMGFNEDPPATERWDPIVRLVELWLQKLRWVLSGDTETIAFRDSEFCYGLVPTGDSVELSFFSGSEAEIEDYLVEPTNVRLDAFAPQCLEMGQRAIALIEAVAPEKLQEDELCKDLVKSLADGQAAWKDYQLKHRR